MLTDEEKKVAEQRALDRIREEQHTAEIKMYEQKIEDDARAKLRTEDAKTNFLYFTNNVILGCVVVALLGSFMLFKRFAMDLTYEDITIWYWCVGAAIGWPICIALIEIMESLNGTQEKKMRNYKSGVSRLLLFSLIGSLIFIAIPRGYVHCPYDEISKHQYGAQLAYVHEQQEHHKDILLKMFWIAFGLSCVGFIAAKKTLRNSSLT